MALTQWKPQRFKSSIIRSSTRTYLGLDINSDHDLIMCNLKLKVHSNKTHKNKRIRYNENKLKDPRICKVYSEHLDVKFNELEKNIKDCNPTEIYTKFEKIITSSAPEIIGKYRSKKHPLMTDDILDLFEEKRILKS